MITWNQITYEFWKITDPFWIWVNSLNINVQWVLGVGLGMFCIYLLYKLYNWYSERPSKKTPLKLPEEKYEKQIDCNNNKDSKIINNVYNF